MTDIIIRKGLESDLEAVHALVYELAVYEKAPQEVETSPAQYARDGFGERSFFEFFVAEHPQEGIVGIAFFYFGYSTWKGKLLYLDDLVITEKWRRQGIGSRLLDRVVSYGLEKDARQIRWQVLDWNEPAIKMYEKVKARFDGEWLNCYLSREKMEGWQ
jgi:GNAT superfamily N-acetyltransferase